ncbi:hypothetical protein Goshw_018715, partial [Gossypium schwendimanii]|nr:hypothetical protein [Gossypium schwendimanii]
HGPVFSLRLGSQLFVVVSYSVLAEECFTKNDIILANRPKLITRGSTSAPTTPWLHHVLLRLNSIITVQKDEVQRLLVRLSRDSRRGFAKDGCREEVLRDKVTNENEAREFREVITGAFRNVGTANGADFLPVDEHRWMKQEKNNNGSVIDHLLNLQQFDPHYYTDEIIKGLMLPLDHPRSEFMGNGGCLATLSRVVMEKKIPADQ